MKTIKIFLGVSNIPIEKVNIYRYNKVKIWNLNLNEGDLDGMEGVNLKSRVGPPQLSWAYLR